MNDSDSDLCNSSNTQIQPQAISAELLHDLHAPLNQIIGYSQMLGKQAQQENRDDLTSDAEKIRSAGKQLLSLIETHFQALPDNPSTQASPSTPASSEVPDAALKNDAAEESCCLILIVDDNESNRDVLARRLRKQDFRIEMAQDGHKALEKMSAHSFDVVLLDIMMPGMDGYEVLRRMKADDVLRHIPVIMISALNEMDSVVRCIEMGAEDYLPKPFSPTLLHARIGACLEKKRAHDREARLLAQAQKNYAQLRHIEQQRDDLTHMVIHDLRSPLSSNIAGIEMVEMLGPLQPEQKECLKIAWRSGQNLLELINDLLDISKMEAGALSLELMPCRAASIVAMAVDQIMPLLNDKKLQVARELPPDLPPLRADENKLRRILVNLLSNSIKFAPKNGIITLQAREWENQVLFSIHDTGEGIPPDALERIFDKFAQVENRKGGRQNSTGLGLTFCKMAVEAHNGRIWAESTPGQGSTFLFTIPQHIGE